MGRKVPHSRCEQKSAVMAVGAVTVESCAIYPWGCLRYLPAPSSPAGEPPAEAAAAVATTVPMEVVVAAAWQPTRL